MMRIISDPESQVRLDVLTARLEELRASEDVPRAILMEITDMLQQAFGSRNQPVPPPKRMALLDQAPAGNVAVVGLSDGRIAAMQLLRGEWGLNDFGGHKVLTEDEASRAQVMRIKPTSWKFNWHNPDDDIAERAAPYRLIAVEYPYGDRSWRRIRVGFIPKLSQWVVDGKVDEWSEE